MHCDAKIGIKLKRNALDCINCSMMSGYTATKQDGVFRPFLAKLQMTVSQLFLNISTVLIRNLFKI